MSKFHLIQSSYRAGLIPSQNSAIIAGRHPGLITKAEIIQDEKLLLEVNVFQKGHIHPYQMSFRAIVDWQQSSAFYQTLLGLGVIPRKGAVIEMYSLVNMDVIVEIQEHVDDAKGFMYSISSISKHTSLPIAL